MNSLLMISRLLCCCCLFPFILGDLPRKSINDNLKYIYSFIYIWTKWECSEQLNLFKWLKCGRSCERNSKRTINDDSRQSRGSERARV